MKSRTAEVLADRDMIRGGRQEIIFTNVPCVNGCFAQGFFFIFFGGVTYRQGRDAHK